MIGMGGTGFVGVLRCAQDDSKDKQQQGQGQPQVLRLRGSQNALSHFAQDDNFWRGWKKTVFLGEVEENRQQLRQLKQKSTARGNAGLSTAAGRCAGPFD
jgi:hypothetical protein